MPKSLDIFYDEDWIDEDRIKLVEQYSDRKELVDGERRLVYRTMTGYEVFIDNKYVFEYFSHYPQSKHISKLDMSFNMYVEVIKKIAKVSERDVNDIAMRLMYRDE